MVPDVHGDRVALRRDAPGKRHTQARGAKDGPKKDQRRAKPSGWRWPWRGLGMRPQ